MIARYDASDGRSVIVQYDDFIFDNGDLTVESHDMENENYYDGLYELTVIS